MQQTKIPLAYGMITELNQSLVRMLTLTGEPGLVVAKTRRSIKDEVEVYEQLRRNLFLKYGTETDGQITVPADNREAFTRELMELMNRKTEVTIFQMPEESFDIDALYCETAEARDYELFEALMVEHEDKNGNLEKEQILDK